MKHSSNNILSFLLLCLFFFTSCIKGFSQNPNIDSTDNSAQNLLNKNIHLFKLTDGDIAFVYNTFSAGAFPKVDTLKGIGKIIILNSFYFFYRKANKQYIIKYLDYFFDDSCCKSHIKASLPLEVASDSNATWLLAAAPKIPNDWLLPFIYKTEANGTARYEVGSILHLPNYEVAVYTNSEKYLCRVEQLSLEKSLLSYLYDSPKKSEDPINLNYEANSSTTLFRFINTIRNSTKYLDAKIEFIE